MYDLARRLTEKQIEEIVKGFVDGTNLDLLSQQFNCTKLTVIRNLKKNLGELKYFDLSNKNKSLVGKSKTNKIKSSNLDKNIENVDLIKESNNSEVLNENITASNFSSYESFFEIAPLDYEIDNLSR